MGTKLFMRPLAAKDSHHNQTSMVGIKAIKASGIVGNISPKTLFDNPLVGISFCTIEQELNARHKHPARTVA